MLNKLCPCPYIPCTVRGNCQACATKNMKDNEIMNCAERIAIKKYGMVKPVTPINTIRCSDSRDVAYKTALKIKECVDKKPNALFCFPAGSTAVETYQILKEMCDKGEVDFSKAKFVALDEWWGLGDNPENCTHFMKRNFYEPLKIKPEQVMFFDVLSKDAKSECEKIDKFIFENGKIDFLLLGIGMNGHIGLIEPNTTWDSYTLVVELDEVTKSVGQKYFSSGTPLTQGITIGMKHVFESQTVVLQVFGEKKASILKRTTACQPDFDMPASVLKLLPDSYIIADQEALSLVNEEHIKLINL